MSEASSATLDRLAREGIEVICVRFDGVYRGGGGIHRSTALLLRDPAESNPGAAETGSIPDSPVVPNASPDDQTRTGPKAMATRLEILRVGSTSAAST